MSAKIDAVSKRITSDGKERYRVYYTSGQNRYYDCRERVPAHIIKFMQNATRITGDERLSRVFYSMGELKPYLKTKIVERGTTKWKAETTKD